MYNILLGNAMNNLLSAKINALTKAASIINLVMNQKPCFRGRILTEYPKIISEN